MSLSMKRGLAIGLLVLLPFVAYGMYKAYEHAAHSVTLPAPTGTLATGTMMYHLVDKTRHERHSKNHNDHRELMLQIWYPAQLKGNEQKALYAHDAVIKSIKQALVDQAHAPANTFHYLNSLRTHSVEKAPILAGTYPIIIFSPGAGAPINLYTSLLEELASQGYIVVGINHPYLTDPVVFPDGRIISAPEQPSDQAERRNRRNEEYLVWVKDIEFVADQLMQMNADEKSMLHNHLDFQHLGVAGHSFGGSAAVRVCQEDKRFIAGIDIDGKLYPSNQDQKLTVPFMFLVAPHSKETLQPIKDLIASTTAPTKYVELAGADHGSFTDFYVLARWDKPPELDPLAGIHATRKNIVDFFNEHLKKEPVERHSLFIQGSLNNPILTSIKSQLHPVINSIIKEEVGLSKDFDFDFFLPKSWQRLTVYHAYDTRSTGANDIYHAIEGAIQKNKNLFVLKEVHLTPEAHFFGDQKDELVIMVKDPLHELSHLNQTIKPVMHNLNTAYEAKYADGLYDISKSERFSYLPHVGLGRIRTTSIKQHVKDASRVDEVFNRITQRILVEALRITKELLNSSNMQLTFEKVVIFDPQSRMVKELPL